VVLVFDDEALRVMTALNVLKDDLVEFRIPLVQNISKPRSSQPVRSVRGSVHPRTWSSDKAGAWVCREQELEVVYLVTPTAKAVDAIIEDFADPRMPKYHAARLLFLSRVRTCTPPPTTRRHEAHPQEGNSWVENQKTLRGH
jgi:hypothetical protein